MATDISTLVNMVSQTSRGTQSSTKTAGGFRQPNNLPRGNKNPGGFSPPWQDPVHQAQMRSLAKVDSKVSFINQYGERESGHRYKHFPVMPLSNYQRILNMVQDANAYERIRVTAPPGTVERQAQLGEQMGNPAGIRERRKTVREVLTGRR
jgi:hypothetical protein